MKCPHCSKELSNPNLRFCTFCGESIKETEKKMPTVTPPPTQPTPQVQPEWKKYLEQDKEPTPPPSKPVVEKAPPVQKPVTVQNDESEFDIVDTVNKVVNTVNKKMKTIDVKNNVPKSIVSTLIQPCDGEKPIKQYNFMQMKLMFPFKYLANGILQITNKRIIYSLLGSGKDSVDYSFSEFSIDDVAGISFSKTTNFSLLDAILYIVFLPLIMGLGIMGMINQYLTVFLAIAGVAVTYYLFKNKHKFWLYFSSAIFAGTCLISIAETGIDTYNLINFMLGGGLGDLFESFGFVNVLLLLFVLYFWVMILIGYFRCLRRINITLNISSKSGAATPISCAQEGIFSLSNNKIQSFCIIEPTKDTDVMSSEIGAMISDIQKLGDYGIEKWSEK